MIHKSWVKEKVGHDHRDQLWMHSTKTTQTERNFWKQKRDENATNTKKRKGGVGRGEGNCLKPSLWENTGICNKAWLGEKGEEAAV